jgi:hypothetical protein
MGRDGSPLKIETSASKLEEPKVESEEIDEESK